VRHGREGAMTDGEKARVGAGGAGIADPDLERWAEALAIERRHGADAQRIIADRIAALSRTGDEAGVERWRQIAAKLDELRAPSALN